jgi:pimeloyl-ACP methyl ester carboxylesterase
MQWADELPGFAQMFIERSRLLQRPWIQKDHHIKLWPRLVIGLNPLQLHLHQFCGSERAGHVRCAHIQMKRFDCTKLTAPILIVSGALDILTPPETGAALAALYGATYRLEPAHGHNVLLGEAARRIAGDVIAWVGGWRLDRRSRPLTDPQERPVALSKRRQN